MGRFYTPPQGNGYQSQFVGTDFDFMQKRLQEKQDRYDTANVASASAMASMHEVATANERNSAAKDEVMAGLTSQLDEIKDRYNGDLSEASSEITQFIGNSRKSKFWGLNKKANEESLNYKAAIRANQSKGIETLNYGVNFDVRNNDGTWNSGDNIRYDIDAKTDWIKSGQDVIDKIPISSLDATKAEWEQAMKKENFSGDIRSWITVKGISEADIKKIANNSDVITSFLKNTPQFSKAHKANLTGYELKGQTVNQAAASFLFGVGARQQHSLNTVNTRNNSNGRVKGADGKGPTIAYTSPEATVLSKAVLNPQEAAVESVENMRKTFDENLFSADDYFNYGGGKDGYAEYRKKHIENLAAAKEKVEGYDNGDKSSKSYKEALDKYNKLKAKEASYATEEDYKQSKHEDFAKYEEEYDKIADQFYFNNKTKKATKENIENIEKTIKMYEDKAYEAEQKTNAGWSGYKDDTYMYKRLAGAYDDLLANTKEASNNYAAFAKNNKALMQEAQESLGYKGNFNDLNFRQKIKVYQNAVDYKGKYTGNHALTQGQYITFNESGPAANNILATMAAGDGFNLIDESSSLVVGGKEIDRDKINFDNLTIRPNSKVTVDPSDGTLSLKVVQNLGGGRTSSGTLKISSNDLAADPKMQRFVHIAAEVQNMMHLSSNDGYGMVKLDSLKGNPVPMFDLDGRSYTVESMEIVKGKGRGSKEIIVTKIYDDDPGNPVTEVVKKTGTKSVESQINNMYVKALGQDYVSRNDTKV